VERAFEILDYLATTSRQASLTEIARALELNKSTCFNILRTLAAAGVIVKDSRFPIYRLGPKLIELGTASRRNVNHRNEIKQILRPFVDRIDLTCLITQPLPHFRGVVVVDRVLPKREAPLAAPIGQVYPLTSPAIGSVIAAHEDAHDLLHDTDFNRLPAGDARIILDRAEETRQRGYGISLEEANEGINAVAATIPDRAGAVSLVLCIMGTADELPAARIDELGPELSAVAYRASLEL
jgi:IclR family transcriptional regulator, acetate operon repressor